MMAGTNQVRDALACFPQVDYQSYYLQISQMGYYWVMKKQAKKRQMVVYRCLVCNTTQATLPGRKLKKAGCVHCGKGTAWLKEIGKI
jgi:hypothetical protein